MVHTWRVKHPCHCQFLPYLSKMVIGVCLLNTNTFVRDEEDILKRALCYRLVMLFGGRNSDADYHLAVGYRLPRASTKQIT